MVKEAYGALGLQTYFTSGETETRAWTICSGWTAPQAAGVIHSDFERCDIGISMYAGIDQGPCDCSTGSGSVRVTSTLSGVQVPFWGQTTQFPSCFSSKKTGHWVNGLLIVTGFRFLSFSLYTKKVFACSLCYCCTYILLYS